MHKESFYINARFLAVLFALNAVFFYLYNLKLALPFSFFGSVFIFLFVFDFLAAFLLARSYLARFILLAIFGSLIVFSLINFAYFKVFNTFLELDIKRAGAINQPLLSLLKDFYLIVPVFIYLASLLLVSFILLALFLHNRRLQRYYYQLDCMSRKIDFLKKAQSGRYTYSRVVLMALFIGINLLCGSYAVVARRQILADSPSRQDYFARIGVLGHLFYSSYDAVRQKIHQVSPGVTLANTNKTANLFEQINEAQGLLGDLGQGIEQKESAMTPRLEKPHIIFYQLESVGAWTLKQDPTPMPFLTELIKENLSADKFYSNSCTTNNAEFSAMCGFYPESFGPISDLYSDNNYYCLPSILKERFGYSTSMFHANEAEFWNRNKLAPKWGIDNLYFSPAYAIRTSDYAVVDDLVKKIASSSQPTFSYFVSFFTHAPHEQELIDFYQESEGIKITPYAQPFNFRGKISADETTIRNYFGFLEQEDLAIRHLFDKLAASNLLNNTVVVVYGDHRYYPFMAGGPEVERLEDYNLLPFVAYLPGSYKGVNKKLASQVDIAPTIMNLLEGDDYGLPESFVGQSLFSRKHPEFAVNKCLGEVIFANQEVVLKKDLALDKFTVIQDTGQYSKYKVQEYRTGLEGLVDLTDRAMQNDLLGRAGESLASVAAHNVSRKVDLNQLADSDHDGLSDMREYGMRTDRYDPDTDNDGYLDGEEVLNGYNPLGAGKLAK